MGMAAASEIFAAGSEGNCDGRLRDQLSRARAADVHAENTIRRRIGQRSPLKKSLPQAFLAA
jgi:hypothetical protein